MNRMNPVEDVKARAARKIGDKMVGMMPSPLSGPLCLVFLLDEPTWPPELLNEYEDN